jgi:chromosome segregation ATPase
LLTEAVPKNEFDTLKSNFAELEEKIKALSLVKDQLEEEVRQKSLALDSADHRIDELEHRISGLEGDILDMAEGSKILDQELLGKQFSFPFRCGFLPV